jgi:hypothetical protein
MKNKRLSTSWIAEETAKTNNIRQIICQCGGESYIEPLTAMEKKIFRCLIEKIRLVSNDQKRIRICP